LKKIFFNIGLYFLTPMFDVETNVVFFKILKFWMIFEKKFFILKF